MKDLNDPAIGARAKALAKKSHVVHSTADEANKTRHSDIQKLNQDNAGDKPTPKAE